METVSLRVTPVLVVRFGRAHRDLGDREYGRQALGS
jgi:hypothetical protein